VRAASARCAVCLEILRAAAAALTCACKPAPTDLPTGICSRHEIRIITDIQGNSAGAWRWRLAVSRIRHFRGYGISAQRRRERIAHDAGTNAVLLPHERWLVGLMLGNQRTHKTVAVVELEQGYGPVGMIWLDAYFANLLFFVVPAMASFIPIFATPTRTSRIALYLFGAALLFLVLSVVRLLQAVRAGRKFRRTGQ
jgi:hypothetical protein